MQFWNINDSTIFFMKFQCCLKFHGQLIVNIWWICSRGSKFSVPVSGEAAGLMQKCFYRCKNSTDLYVTHLMFVGLGLCPHWGRKSSMFIVCSLSVVLFSNKVCERHVTIKRLELWNNFLAREQKNMVNWAERDVISSVELFSICRPQS